MLVRNKKMHTLLVVDRPQFNFFLTVVRVAIYDILLHIVELFSYSFL